MKLNRLSPLLARRHAIPVRIGTDDVLFDVCESTNKRPLLDACLQRSAIPDRDPRGGGMALIADFANA